MKLCRCPIYHSDIHLDALLEVKHTPEYAIWLEWKNDARC